MKPEDRVGRLDRFRLEQKGGYGRLTPHTLDLSCWFAPRELRNLESALSNLLDGCL